eukprot:scaffold293256_cov14-Prasinocladus_malaysianus.AAC.1
MCGREVEGILSQRHTYYAQSQLTKADFLGKNARQSSQRLSYIDRTESGATFARAHEGFYAHQP